MRVYYLVVLILVLANLGFAIPCADLTNNATWQNSLQGNITAGFTVNGSVRLCPTTDDFSGVTAFTVTEPNVTINCMGATINGDNTSGTYGIYTNQNGTIIEYCNISNFSYGINFDGASNGEILGSNASSSANIAIYLDSATNDTIMDSIATATTGAAFNIYQSSNDTIIDSSGYASGNKGIDLYSGSSNNMIIGSNGTSDSDNGIFVSTNSDNNNITGSIGASNDADGIHIEDSTNNTIIGSNGTSNSTNGILLEYSTYDQVLDSNGNSSPNSGFHIYGSNHETVINSTGSSDSFIGMELNSGSSYDTIIGSNGTSNSYYGIGDFEDSGDVFMNCTGTSDSSSGFYLDENANETVIGSSATSGSFVAMFIVSDGNDNIIDSVAASGSSDGIYLSGASNTSISGSNLTSGTDRGVEIAGSGSNNTFNNCSIDGSSGTYGAFNIQGSNNDTIGNSTINGEDGPYAITIVNSGDNTGNVFINDSIMNASTLLYLDGSAAGNIFCWDNFTQTSGYYAQDSGSDYFNSSLCDGEGNIWANVMNGSVNISGAMQSSGFPSLFIGMNSYNDNDSLGMTSGVVDYAPLTPFISPPLTVAFLQPTSAVQFYEGDSFNVSLNTTCSQSGDCGYTNTSVAYETPSSPAFGYTGGYQYWTVPDGVTSITLNVSGASGGYISGYTPGNGANMVGTFAVTPGEVLSILVGQSPGPCSGSCSYPAGGGGSFVALGATYSNATPLIVAGGGGAAYGSSGVDAPVTENGTGDSPGTNGNGAPAVQCAGGGGGFYSSGGSDTEYPGEAGAGGAGFQQGGAGGTDSSSEYQAGGFGGGAQADYIGYCNTEAGSGGGYSGGSGTIDGSSKYYGEAGGSYNSGTSEVNTSGYNSGNGQVIISYDIVKHHVSGVVNATPFYTTSPNPQSASLSAFQSATANFTLVATEAGDYELIGIANNSSVSAAVPVHIFARVPPTPVQVYPEASAYAPPGSDVSLNFSCNDGIIDDIELWTDLNGTWSEAYANSSYTSGMVSVPFYSQPEGFYHWAVYCHATYGGSAWSANRTINVTTAAISSCQDLTDPGTYLLSQNITSSSDCFNVYSDNVTLDCLGHSITGPGTSRDGLDADSVDGTVIRNCTFTDFEYGIYFQNASYGQVVNNTFSSDYYGLYLDYASSDGSDYNYIGSNNFANNYFGFYVYQSDSNLFAYNNVTNTGNSNFGGGSCPMLFTYNGTGYDFQQDIGVTGGLGKKLNKTLWDAQPFYTDPAKTPSYFEDYAHVDGDRLAPRTSGNDTYYDIRLNEEFQEVEYVDKLQLFVIDHAPGFNVYPDIRKNGSLYTISDSASPVYSASDQTGKDVSADISSRDGVFWSSSDDSTPSYLQLKLLPGDANRQYLRLLVSMTMTNPAESYNVSIPSLNTTRAFVQFLNQNGQWVNLPDSRQIDLVQVNGTTYTVTPNYYGVSNSVFDLSGLNITNNTIRLVVPDNSKIWHIDRILVDTSAPQNYSIARISPYSADLHFKGVSQLVPLYNGAYAPQTSVYDNVTDMEGVKYNLSGNATRYGDVTPLLSDVDDEYVIMTQGDEIASKFAVPPLQSGLSRDFIVYTWDYYKEETAPLGNTIGPLPFRAMSGYPYNTSVESYPSDAAHQAYLAQWNTREFQGGDSGSSGVSLPYSFNNTIYQNTIIGGSDGLYLDNEDATSIIQNNISSVQTGVYADFSENLNISGNNITNAEYGVEFYYSSSSNVSGNMIAGISSDALELESDCYDSNFTDNSLNSSDVDIYSQSSNAGNSFLHNTIIGDEWVDDYSSDNAYNDSTTGNIYYLANGTGAWEIYNITSSTNSGWADSGSDLPFSSSLSGGEWYGNEADWHPYTGSANPSPTYEDSGHSTSKSSLTLSESFNCSSGQLTVSSGVSGLPITLIPSASAGSQQAQTDASGNAVFTVPSSGSYQIYSQGNSDYLSATDNAELDLCPVQQNQTITTSGCSDSSSCDQDQQCVAGSCVAVECSCGQIEDHACVAYACCSDSDCSSGICQDHSCVAQQVQNQTQQNQTQNVSTGPTQADATAAISDAESAISAASGSGKNVTEAQTELAQAQAALSSGNYALAMSLALQSRAFANAAAAPGQSANLSGTSTMNPPPFNWFWVIGIVVIVVIAGLGYYLFVMKKPKKR